MKKADLIKAADELNEVIFDPDEKQAGWLDTKAPPAKLKKKIKEASLWLYESDEVSEKTVETLKQLEFTEEDFKILKADQDPLPFFERNSIFPLEVETPIEDSESPDSGLSPESNTSAPLEEENAPTPPKTEPKEYLTYVPPKLPATIPVSAYGTALAIMGKVPDLSFGDLCKKMKEEGFDIRKKSATIRTARSIARKMWKYHCLNGFVKDEYIKK